MEYSDFKKYGNKKRLKYQNKPAAQAAGADPSQYKSTNRRSHPNPEKNALFFEAVMQF